MIIVPLIIQTILLYFLPLFAGATDAMGMVVLLLVSAFLLALAAGCLERRNIKYLYPLLVSVIFLPSVRIYYNETALIHSLWYAVMTSGGILIGSGIRWLFGLLNR